MHASGKLIAFAAASLLIGMGSVCAEEALMTPDQMKSEWVGKKLLIQFSVSPSAGNPTGFMLADFYLKADGTAEIQGVGWGHTGQWRFSKDGYCTTYKTLRNGEEKCYTVIRNGSRATFLNPQKTAVGQLVKVVDL